MPLLRYSAFSEFKFQYLANPNRVELVPFGRSLPGPYRHTSLNVRVRIARVAESVNVKNQYGRLTAAGASPLRARRCFSTAL